MASGAHTLIRLFRIRLCCGTYCEGGLLLRRYHVYANQDRYNNPWCHERTVMKILLAHAFMHTLCFPVMSTNLGWLCLSFRPSLPRQRRKRANNPTPRKGKILLPQGRPVV